MFLTKENGMRIVEEIKETIGRDVNIMDRTGTILASTDPKRIGQLHTIAKEILEQQLPVLEVAAGKEGPGAQQGVNLPIYVDGNCEGVIGITGPPDAVRDFGAIVKKMTEILLTTMRQQEQSLLVEQARSLFLEEWLFAQDLDWSAFAERGALLDIDIREPKRIAILEYEPRGTAQPPELHGGRLLQMAQRYVQGEQTLCAVVNRRLLLVFGPEQKALEVLKQFQQAAESFYEVTLSGGLSSLSRGAEDIRRCYNEAKIAARAAAKNHTILEYSGISLDFVLQNLEPKVKADVCRAIFETVPGTSGRSCWSVWSSISAVRAMWSGPPRASTCTKTPSATAWASWPSTPAMTCAGPETPRCSISPCSFWMQNAILFPGEITHRNDAYHK